MTNVKMQRDGPPYKWLVPYNLNIGLIEGFQTHTEGTTFDFCQPCLKPTSIQSRVASRSQLNAYLSRHTFHSITAELTIGSLFSLVTISRTPTSQILDHLTLLCDLETYPSHTAAILKGLLRCALTNLLNIRTITIKLKPRLPGDELFIKFHYIREIRVEFDEVLDLEYLKQLCTKTKIGKQGRQRARRAWAFRWNSLQKVHFLAVSVEQNATDPPLFGTTDGLTRGMRSELEKHWRAGFDGRLRDWQAFFQIRKLPAEFVVEQVREGNVVRTMSRACFGSVEPGPDTGEWVAGYVGAASPERLCVAWQTLAGMLKEKGCSVKRDAGGCGMKALVQLMTGGLAVPRPVRLEIGLLDRGPADYRLAMAL